MKGFMGKSAIAAAVVVGPIVGITTGTAEATPVWGGAQAIASPWWHVAQWSNLQIAQAYGPSNLQNYVKAESLRGCVGCDALAVNVQVDLVSYASTPPNETNVAQAIDQGGTGDTNLAAAAQFVVDAPGRVSLSWQGWSQLGSIDWQLHSLSLRGSSGPAVQAEINGLLGQVVGILEANVTVSGTTPAVSPAVGTPAVSPAVAPAATSGVQVTSNIQFDS